VWRQLRSGFVATLPVATSTAAYGAVLGMLAVQKAISWQALAASDLIVFAGSAQFVMVDMWNQPLPVLAMALAVLMINLRYLLIGASLRPLFVGKSLWHKITHMHLVADENWAITLAAHRQGRATSEFLLGGGLCILTFWTSGTLLGHRLAAVVAHPEVLALDFAFTAVFMALTVSLWRDKRDLLPWIVAAGLAVVAARLLPDKWYILIGGIGGALTAALRRPADEQGDA
jgi:4-azaleucine resistance transporter AzlC